MTTHISQREAFRLKKRVRELESQVNSIKSIYAGVRLSQWSFNDTLTAEVKTAKTLGYITLILPTYDGKVEIRAIKL